MAGPKPILQNGLSSTQGIWDVIDSGVTNNNPVHRVGTRAHLNDGRVFYYSRQSASNAIVAGNLLASPLASVDFDDMVTTAAAVGAKVMNCTNVGSATYAANDLAEGYFCVNSATTGAGWAVKIESHATWGATTALDVNLYDGIPVATTGTVRSHVIQNPYQDVVIMPTDGAAAPAGVANIAVAAGNTNVQYFWCQTWGTCCVTSGDTSALGQSLMADSGTAGETKTYAGAAGDHQIGIQVSVAIDGDFVFANLQIAP